MGITSVSDYAWGHLSQHATGTVHSVFSSSLNVELDGLLLHLGSSDAPLSCLGANVDAEEMPALVGSAVQGDRAVFRDGVLRIYSRARVSELELSAAPVRCMRVPELAGAFPNDIDALCCARSVPSALPTAPGCRGRIGRGAPCPSSLDSRPCVVVCLTRENGLAAMRRLRLRSVLCTEPSNTWWVGGSASPRRAMTCSWVLARRFVSCIAEAFRVWHKPFSRRYQVWFPVKPPR